MPVINSPHDYQQDGIDQIFDNWNYYQNICFVAPTGAGKTIIKAFVAKQFLQRNPNQMVVVFAHRDVLLSQISLAFAKVGIPHKMLCSRSTEVEISNVHMDELGESWLDDGSRVIIASVKSWVNADTSYLESLIGAWLMDEAHHLLCENQWGEAVAPLENAVGLGVTATPKRGDKKGLGRTADGVFDVIVQSKTMGELIAMGRLSKYKVYSIPERFTTEGIPISSSGDYNQVKLANRTHKVMKSIIGDAVSEYKRLCNGAQGIIFADSVAHSEQVAKGFRDAGINAVALSSNTDTQERHRAVRDFRAGKITILVNYDLFGEGFDVPAVVYVGLLRKTLSYGLFKQMVGRCLRVLDGKEYGILVDHAGNVPYFLSTELEGKLLHDDPEWSLERPGKKRKPGGGISLVTRVCPACRGMYQPLGTTPKYFVCPYPECGHAESQEETNQVQTEIRVRQGQLVEMDTSYLNDMIAKINQVDEDPESMRNRMKAAGMSNVVVNSAVKRHRERQEQQEQLRQLIHDWCDYWVTKLGFDVPTVQNEFNVRFNVDIFKAQTLSGPDTAALKDKVRLAIYEDLLS